ncbi:hypothetical protein N8E89_23050 (plasmid) [Phyllobacterium sp. A18/5-2]|uniref:hypothetical protein n=1 Tax=Phyllobacterium sp. A18/5-2 TaxID=2978392 RepID=UPI0021C75F9E|nr:hypothetical protein [Phyllobacterium sp. A18/5-2]UXN66097.1 hypothetical protein N8E89_23050 [Phyllobacterium sp. A18/5-2]
MVLANGDTVAVAALNGNELDPLMMFDPYSSEEIPISILDEYLELINGKYVCWSKPKENGYQFLCDLHDISNYQIHPAWDRQRPDMQFLTVAMRLRGHHERFDTWIGRVDENIFHPQIDRRTSKRTDMATILQPTDGASSLALVYQTKISVNISLAARSMKRRALGLCVADV